MTDFSPTAQSLPGSAPRRAVDRLALVAWRRLTPTMQSHPRLRSLLMVRAARCDNGRAPRTLS